MVQIHVVLGVNCIQKNEAYGSKGISAPPVRICDPNWGNRCPKPYCLQIHLTLAASFIS